VKKKKSPYVVGIDLGTSNSSISVCHRGAPRTILVGGKKTMPSVVRFAKKKADRKTVGENAKKYKLVNPDEVFSSFKSMMKSDEWRQAEGERFQLEGAQITPTDLAAEVLNELLEKAHEQQDIDLKGVIQRAVICVPANTTDEYRKNVYAAAAKANLGETDEEGKIILDDNGRPRGVMLLEEPTAAAIAYGHEWGLFKEKKKQTILVYDMGGGTFDVTILQVDSSGEGPPKFNVINTKGIAKLGGDDFDEVLMKHCAARFQEDNKIDIFDLQTDCGIPPKALKQAQQKLKEHCEKAKIEMSEGRSQAEVEDAAFLADESGNQLTLRVEVKKKDFVGLIEDFLNQAKTCVLETLQEKELTIDDMSRIILVGGSTKADWVVDSVKSLYPPGEERDPFNAKDVDVIVSQGAALFGASQTTPTEETGDVEMEVASIVSHYLGIELENQQFGVILEKGLPLDDEHPLQTATRVFGNQENQDTIQIVVWKTQKTIEFTEENDQRKPTSPSYVTERDEQGNRIFDCIGEYTLKGIPKGPRGSEKIEVSMTLDRENMLKVTSKILSVGSAGELELAVDAS